jgi:hypothetical protein
MYEIVKNVLNATIKFLGSFLSEHLSNQNLLVTENEKFFPPFKK